MKIKQDDYLITDNKENIDIDFIIRSLQETYWAKNRKKEVIINSIDNSILISMFKKKQQIGFSRIVTDKAAFAWVADVYIDKKYRGKGLGKWLVKNTTDHPDIKNVFLQLLKTKDAHGVYEKFGFKRDDCLTKRKISEEL